MTTRKASCSCGQLNLKTQGEPVRISVCHCLACQRRTGSIFGVQARFTAEKVKITGQSNAYIRKADSGNQITLHFCPECGSTVYYHPSDKPDVVVVPIGSFADPEFLPPRVSVYESMQHPWAKLPEDVQHLD
jgi:hypothetical protein